MSVRTRSRTTIFKSKTVIRKTDRRNNSFTETISYPANLGPTTTITDENHSGFEKRRKTGELIFGSLVLNRSEKTFKDGLFVFDDVYSRYKITGDLITSYNFGTNPPYPPSYTSQIDSCRAKAAISALKKLNEAETDCGEILATMAQTIGMMSRPFSGMQKLLHKMEKSRIKKFRNRKGSPPSVGDYAKATADTWLEQSFGWRPLFGDTFKFMGMHIDKSLEMEKVWKFARGGAKYEDSIHEAVTGTATGGLLVGATADVIFVRNFTYRSNCGVVYQIKGGFGDDYYSRHLGLGANNLLVSAWNLTPYSWVVDQVVGVGDWIQAAMPSPGIVELQRWRTDVRTEEVKTFSLLSVKRKPYDGPLTTYYGSGGERNELTTTINRSLTFDLPSNPQWNPFLGNFAIALNNVAFGYQMVNSMLKRWVH